MPLEAHMIEPIRRLMKLEMQLDVIVQEFSAGYGIADIVGAKLCSEGCESRKKMGVDTPLDHKHLVQVLLSLRPRNKTSLESLLQRVMISESTLRSKVLPKLKRLGLIEYANDYIQLRAVPAKPTRDVIAVEAKQTRWRDAIFQARRYSFFADQTYIAVWGATTRLIDKSLLYRHRLGLISVEVDSAEIVVEAPKRSPREAEMSRFCAEYLYGHALNSGMPTGNDLLIDHTRMIAAH